MFRFLFWSLFVLFLFHLRDVFHLECMRKTLLSERMGGKMIFFCGDQKVFTYILMRWCSYNERKKRTLFDDIFPLCVCTFIYYTCDHLNKVSSRFGFHLITKNIFFVFFSFMSLFGKFKFSDKTWDSIGRMEPAKKPLRLM